MGPGGLPPSPSTAHVSLSPARRWCWGSDLLQQKVNKEEPGALALQLQEGLLDASRQAGQVDQKNLHSCCHSAGLPLRAWSHTRQVLGYARRVRLASPGRLVGWGQFRAHRVPTQRTDTMDEFPPLMPL